MMETARCGGPDVRKARGAIGLAFPLHSGASL